MAEQEELDKKQQEIFFKLSMFEQQIQALQQQLQAVEEGAIDLQTLNFGLDDLKGGTGKEILAPMGRGIFVKAKLLSEDLIVDVGGRNFVGKSIDETKKIIEEQMEKLDKVKREFNEKLSSLDSELARTIEEAQEQNN